MAGTSLKDRLLQILTDSGLITKEQLEEAAQLQKAQGGSISNILIDGNYISENELMMTLSEHLGIPPINLSNIKIPEEVISIIPKQLARFYQVLPISKMGSTLTIAMADPLNVFAIDDLKMLTKMELQPVISTPNAIAEKQNEVFSATSGLDELLKDSAPDVEIKRNEEEEINIDELLEATGDTSVIQVVNIILVQAVQEGSSDIHIEPFEKDVRVRFRTDGILYEKASPPKHMHPAVVSRIKIMSDLDIAERRLPQDGRLGVRIAGRDVDVRVSVLPTDLGERVVLRLLDRSSEILTLEDLGLADSGLDAVDAMIRKSHGIFLVTGPTGSGKTTTLYAALTRLNDREKNIITIEDPVEYRLPGVGQIQVNSRIDLTFAAGLRSILRQDPDLIMVGEIRDVETAGIAVQSALTGHMVFSTLHTNDAATALTRLVEMGVEPFLAASSIVGILAQRLVRKICPDCRQEYVPDQRLLEEAGFDALPTGTKLYRGVGCELCHGSGYRGRLGIFELLTMSDSVRGGLMASNDAASIRQSAVDEGMMPLRDFGLQRVLKGETTLEEVLRVTQEEG